MISGFGSAGILPAVLNFSEARTLTNDELFLVGCGGDF